ncbi:MAG: ABC transporter substrate-binding protein [Myxococcales bacterium]|nr:ABC transporter substrate-binding protein [Myxococcales bacterium]
MSEAAPKSRVRAASREPARDVAASPTNGEAGHAVASRATAVASRVATDRAANDAVTARARLAAPRRTGVVAICRLASRAWLASLTLLLAACNTAPPETTTRAAGLTVASQAVLADELLWQLGADARAKVVAVSAMADDPRYSGVVDRWPASVPRIAGASEALLSLAPDRILIASFTSNETRAVLTAHGVTLIELPGFTGFDDFRASVRVVAAAVDEAEAGAALLADFDRRLAALERDRPTSTPGAVSYDDGNVPGARTTFDDIARAAGYRNLAAEHGVSGHAQVTLERLVSWDPTRIVIACAPPSCEASERAFAARPGIEATQAAREGGIVAIPAAQFYSAGADMLEVVARLRARHPEAS